MAKKTKKKVVQKKAHKVQVRNRPQPKTEVVIRVEQAPVIPTVSDLAEPMKDGKNLTMQKTWLSQNQLLRMLQRTPKNEIYKRKGRGNQTFDYVMGSYCVKWLNFNFGWNWEYESVNEPSASEIISLITNKIDMLWVTGKLTVHSPDNKFSIIKMQAGSSDIKFLKDSRKPVDIGDDLKSAHTDALKKCASLLGFASDIYGKVGYKQETGKEPITEIHGLPAIAPGEQTPAGPKAGQIMGPDGHYVWLCSDTDEPISEQEYTFSMQMYGKPLSRAAQANHKPLKK